MTTAAGAFGIGMLAADELPLDQELPIDGLQRADVDVNQLARELALGVEFLDPLAENLADLCPVRVGRPGDERESRPGCGPAGCGC